MKFMWGKKDGGPESEVTCYGFESKRFFSILLLRFTPRTREAFHSHAFNCWNVLLRGQLYELALGNGWAVGSIYHPWRPFSISRDTVHRTCSTTPTCWVFSVRGPWVDTWFEIVGGRQVYLTHGRKVI